MTENNGFKLLKKEFIDEINSKAYVFEHIKTGAKLVKLENDDNEKAFTIGFKTIPEDDTGCPHILEHSVLCGSKKFPMKDPFSTINRTSITTYCNAFTFPDKTVYPFSTTNNAEFFKIMEVYLDSVFVPNVLEDKRIFEQEGWRYVLDSKEDEIKYNGVVYGEMKGAMSSPLQQIEYGSLKNLFPDTSYNYNFGGEPKEITELTYEKFIDFYKKHYHPSNAFIYLYGDGNLDEELKFINDEYLSNFEKLNLDLNLDEQKSFDEERKNIIKYSVSKDEELNNKYFYSYNWALSNSRDFKQILSFSILKKILLGTNASPLKKALIEANLGEDMSSIFECEILQSMMQINILNSSKDKEKEFVKVIYDTLNTLVKEGLDETLVEAVIQRQEFYLKEQIDYAEGLPRGLMFMRDIMKTWLYGGEPLEILKFNNVLEEIKELSKKGYFEDLIQNFLIENKHKLLLVLEPDSNINLENEVKKKLEKFKSTLSEDELNKLIEDNKNISNWQEKEDSQEAMDSIKILEKSQIDSLPQKVELKQKKVDDILIYQYKEKNNGVSYLNLFFDAKIISQEDLQTLGILKNILSEVKTKNFDYEDFSNLININSGGIGYSISSYENKNSKLETKFLVSIKFVESKFEKIIEILNEIFNNIIFDEKKILEILQKVKTRKEIGFVESGHAASFSRVSSYYDEVAHYKDLVSGFSYFDFIKDMIENYENKKEKLINDLTRVYSLIFNKNNLIINLNSKIEDLNLLNNLDLKNVNLETYEYNFDLKKLNEGFKTSASINYVGKGFDFKKLGFEYNGSFLVLKNLLRYMYLWDEVRVKKGAYGSGALVSRQGNFIFWSYRDPNILSTIEIYDNTCKYLENLEMPQEEIFKLVIGAIAEIDRPLDLDQIGLVETMKVLQGISYEDLKKTRTELLNCSLDDLRSLSKVIEAGIKENNICVIGNSDMIEENKDLFGVIKNI